MSEYELFTKYSSLFRKKYMYLDLYNPLIRFVGKQRGIYPNDDMMGTLAYLDNLIQGIY